MPSNDDKPYTVVSGSGAGWGRYDTKQEADERAQYLRDCEVPDVMVAKRVSP